LIEGQFFLEGTMLAALSKQYEDIKLNIESFGSHIERIEEQLPGLEEDEKRWGREVEANAATEMLQQKCVHIHNQLVWAHVAQREKVLSQSCPLIDVVSDVSGC
jgi:hypothetical protein